MSNADKSAPPATKIRHFRGSPFGIAEPPILQEVSRPCQDLCPSKPAHPTFKRWAIVGPSLRDEEGQIPEKARETGPSLCPGGHAIIALMGNPHKGSGVWTLFAGLHPERMRSLSPGLRAARYPGSLMRGYILP